MKSLYLIPLMILTGCSVTTKNIYTMDNRGVGILYQDGIHISIHKDMTIESKTPTQQSIKSNVWKVYATNRNDECVKVKLVWHLSGFDYLSLAEYRRIGIKQTKHLGFISDQIVTYYDFSYSLPGYGRIKELIKEDCN